MGKQKKQETQIIKSKWQKMIIPDQEWIKDDILDVIGAIKQIIALFIGIIYGIIPLYGSTAIFSFLFLCICISFLYYTRYLKIDDEEFGRFEMIQEGLFPSFAIFLLSWIITYNIIYIYE